MITNMGRPLQNNQLPSGYGGCLLLDVYGTIANNYDNNQSYTERNALPGIPTQVHHHCPELTLTYPVVALRAAYQVATLVSISPGRQ